MPAIDFPYVHDLARLLRLLSDDGVNVPEQIVEAKSLTQFALMTRYPNPGPPVTREQWLEAIGLAEAVLAWAEEQIQL